MDIEEESVSWTLLKYGMYFSAMFQLICIAAVVILPNNGNTPMESAENSDSETEHTHVSRKSYGHHRPRKQEKKKRR